MVLSTSKKKKEKFMLLSVVETARVLGVSVETVRRRIKNGQWPVYKLGPKSTRLDPSEIRALGRLVGELEQQRKGALDEG
jgi:excisionase family DNA binding protein